MFWVITGASFFKTAFFPPSYVVVRGFQVFESVAPRSWGDYPKMEAVIKVLEKLLSVEERDRRWSIRAWNFGTSLRMIMKSVMLDLAQNNTAT